MDLKSKVLVGTILLLCSMSMLAGCLGEENTRKEKVSIKVFVDIYCPETGRHYPEHVTPNDFWLSFTEAGYERVSFTFEEGGYIAKYVLDKCLNKSPNCWAVESPSLHILFP